MKVFICLTIFLFTSIQFGTEEIAIYDRDWNLNSLADAKFICAASSEKVEGKRLIAWVGFRDRDFTFPIFVKQGFYILDVLTNSRCLNFVGWLILPRKPPGASFYVKKGLY